MNAATLGVVVLLTILKLSSTAAIPTKDVNFAINVTMKGFDTTKVRHDDLSLPVDLCCEHRRKTNMHL